MSKSLKEIHINNDGEFVIKVKEGFEIISTVGGERIIKATVIKSNRKEKQK